MVRATVVFFIQKAKCWSVLSFNAVVQRDERGQVLVRLVNEDHSLSRAEGFSMHQPLLFLLLAAGHFDRECLASDQHLDALGAAGAAQQDQG